VRAQWKISEGPLLTRWAKDVSPENIHPEYPRPQMRRKKWLNLNGLWEYAIRGKNASKPATGDGQILVPFPVESALSGVTRRVGQRNRLWYRRTFEIPEEWSGASQQRILLHFGAVDWETTVWVNGKQVGSHRGGYDPFTFDITDAINKRGTQDIVVAVWDPADAGTQPRGKQVCNPDGIWYTPTTGIWQTVWLEPVPQTYIDTIKIVPDIDNSSVQITVNTIGDINQCCINAIVKYGERLRLAGGSPGVNTFNIKIPQLKLWSPDSPFLYDLKVKLVNDTKSVDEVSSYFGMRKVSLGKDENGITRLFLNNKPMFMFGPLDQGFWPDGLYTAPTDEALRYDLEVMKKLGFNMARKHVKVEPARWYYWCDKMGLMVWQDMPNGDRGIGPEGDDIQRSEESARQFELELKRIIDSFGNHPSIVMWVLFNEGWGQYDTQRLTKWVKQYDPTRLVDSASGWADRGVGDVHDVHKYPGPVSAGPEPNRAAVLGEFGGLGLPVEGHLWQKEKSWGYRTFKTGKQLTDAYLSLLSKLRPLIKSPGLAAAVYTQITDVESEVNGLMTYDRTVIKMDPQRIAAVNRKLIQSLTYD
jgi:beta-galactosidase/beta-glucuronidase